MTASIKGSKISDRNDQSIDFTQKASSAKVEPKNTSEAQVSPQIYTPPQPDPRFEALDKSVYEDIDESLPEYKKKELIKERKEFVESLKEEIRLPTYKTVMRRVYAFRNYKPNSEGVVTETTDMSRLLRANCKSKHGSEIDQLNADSIIDYESPVELTWYGGVSKFGKRADFVIENLVFMGLYVEGYMSCGDNLLHLKGNIVWSCDTESAAAVKNQSEYGLELNLEGINVKDTAKVCRFKGHIKNNGYHAVIKTSNQKTVPQVIEVFPKSKTCTIFIDPDRKLYSGKISVSGDMIFVQFIEKGKISIVSGKKNNAGAYSLFYVRTYEKTVYKLQECEKPGKIAERKGAYSFCEVNLKFAMVLEVAQDARK